MDDMIGLCDIGIHQRVNPLKKQAAKEPYRREPQRNKATQHRIFIGIKPGIYPENIQQQQTGYVLNAPDYRQPDYTSDGPALFGYTLMQGLQEHGTPVDEKHPEVRKAHESQISVGQRFKACPYYFNTPAHTAI